MISSSVMADGHPDPDDPINYISSLDSLPPQMQVCLFQSLLDISLDGSKI